MTRVHIAIERVIARTHHDGFVIVTTRGYEWHGMPRASQSLSREAAPLDQHGRASLFVNLAGHEMALLVEMVVDLRVN
jgi:hypothetical protein